METEQLLADVELDQVEAGVTGMMLHFPKSKLEPFGNWLYRKICESSKEITIEDIIGPEMSEKAMQAVAYRLAEAGFLRACRSASLGMIEERSA